MTLEEMRPKAAELARQAQEAWAALKKARMAMADAEAKWSRLMREKHELKDLIAEQEALEAAAPEGQGSK